MLNARSVRARRWLAAYFWASAIELAALGYPLLRARSLGGDGLLGPYSAPRVSLIVIWLAALVSSAYVTISRSRRERFAQRLLGWSSTKAQSEHGFDTTREWLITIAVVAWGPLLLWLLDPAVLQYMWVPLLALLQQYWPALALTGLWAAQSAFALRWLGFAHVQGQRAVPAPGPRALWLFLLALLIYLATAASQNIAAHPKTAYFPELAESLLEGRLDITDPPATKDLSLYNDRFYVAFPPLGALLMLPWVALQGSERVNVVLFNALFAALGVMLMYLLLEAARARGISRLHPLHHGMLALFVGLGTAMYSLVLRALVNFTGQVLAVTFLALALWIAASASPRRQWAAGAAAGGALALAVLSRPVVILAWPALLALWSHRAEGHGPLRTSEIRDWVIGSWLPLAGAAAFLGWYNMARFGSPLDLGYDRMLVSPALAGDLARFGQFHPHFVLRNLFDNFLRLPYWDPSCGRLTPHPQGTSLLVASPLLIWTLTSLRRSVLVIGCWLSVVAMVVVHALYYNSGAVQFGYRFSLDFLPIAVLMIAYGLGERFPRILYGLLAWSVAANLVGALWITHRWCVNF